MGTVRSKEPLFRLLLVDRNGKKHQRGPGGQEYLPLVQPQTHVLLTAGDYDSCQLSLRSIIELKVVAHEGGSRGSRRSEEQALQLDALATEFRRYTFMLHRRANADNDGGSGSSSRDSPYNGHDGSIVRDMDGRVLQELRHGVVGTEVTTYEGMGIKGVGAQFLHDWEWWKQELREKVEIRDRREKHEGRGGGGGGTLMLTGEQLMEEEARMGREAVELAQKKEEEMVRAKQQQVEGQEKQKEHEHMIRDRAKANFEKKNLVALEQKRRERETVGKRMKREQEKGVNQFWEMYYRQQARKLHEQLRHTRGAVVKNDVLQAELKWSRLRWGHLYKWRQLIFWKEQAKQQVLRQHLVPYV
jgi:hypothetical protein